MMANGYSFRESRLVYMANIIERAWDSVTGAVGGVASTIGKVTRPIRGAVGIVLAPLSVPKKITVGALRTAYAWTVVPAANAIDLVAGAVKEGALGAKDATWTPLKTIMASGIRDIRMNLVDLPLTVGRNLATVPGHLLHTPGNFLKGTKESLTDIPKNIRALITNTRKNVSEVFSRLISLRPWQALKPIGHGMKDFAKDTIVNPVRSALKPLTESLNPFAQMALETGGVAIGAKWQYIPSTTTAYKESWAGLLRAAHAPGHRLGWPPLDLLQGKAVKKPLPTDAANDDKEVATKETKN